jgi:ankyrin repeat protein
MQKKSIFLILLIVILSSIMLYGCGKSPEEARKELAGMNIQYNVLSFLKAIENNDTVATKLFLEAGMDPNANVDGITPLMVAATKNRLEIAKSLIDKKANVNAKDKDGLTALHYAVIGDPNGSASIDVTKLLIEKGADVNFQSTKDGMTPLMVAVTKGSAEIVKLLLEKGANVNVQTPAEKMTALMLAAGQGDAAIVKDLLAKGADVNIKADKGITALTFAKKTNNQAIADILLQAGAKDETPVAAPAVSTNTNGSSDMELAKKVIYGKWKNPQAGGGYKYNFNDDNIKIIKIISVNPNGESDFKVQIKNDNGNWMTLDIRMVITCKGDGSFEMNIMKRKENGNIINDGEDRIRYQKI